MSLSCRDEFDETSAEMMLEVIRWGNDLERWCPSCAGDDIGRIETRGGLYRCRSCQKQFTVTSGTAFDRHKLPASKLVKAILWYDEFRDAGRVCDLARLLGCTWKTAYVMKMRLWEAFREELGILSGKPFFARWYWQGFNKWHMDQASGQIVRKRKDGRVRVALTQA